MKTRELTCAGPALDAGDFTEALFLLEQSRRVAVAQRKLDGLLEVRELVARLSSRSSGRTRDASQRLAWKVDADLRGFPAEALEAVGVEPEPDLVGPLVAAWKLRTLAGNAPGKTRELSQARTALEEGDAAMALFLLQQARRVAVAQRKLDELLEVYELVQVLSERSSGRTRAATDQLVIKVDSDLGAFAAEANI